MEALQGLKVIELGHAVAGPFCSCLLADFGADVLKIEAPGSGDMLRGMGLFPNLWFTVEDRNKKCVTLDIKSERGKELFTDLLRDADILIQNMRPGTLTKLGFPWDRLQEINPRLILVNISGYGQDGPYRDKPAFDRIGMALGGLTHVTGYRDGPPTRTGIALADFTAGIFGAMGALIAIYNRDVVETGRGQQIDSTLYESILRLMESGLVEYSYAGIVKTRNGNRHIATVPSGHYLTKDEQYLVMAVGGDKLFQKFANLIDMPELLKDERFNTMNARAVHHDEMEQIAEAWVREHTIQECLDILGNDIPCSKVFTVEDMFKDPHFAARNDIISLETEQFGKLSMQNVTPILSETPGHVHWAGPKMGSYNEKLYLEELKLSREEYDQLRSEGII
ncbi:MAG: CoA transferase [Synergistaceae bacterium]|jgi:crotonobetainyl-CoA:carnitine CoA-transferase CaiB-like acyl-CoA transferase|nr:CoA transferase [Synergistaceae bacterium]